MQQQKESGGKGRGEGSVGGHVWTLLSVSVVSFLCDRDNSQEGNGRNAVVLFDVYGTDAAAAANTTDLARSDDGARKERRIYIYKI